MKSRIIIFTSLLCATLSLAEEGVPLVEEKIFYHELLRIENPLRSLTTPVATSYIPFNRAMNIAVGYTNESGDYRSLQMGEQKNLFNLSVSGSKKLGKMAFEGLLDYSFSQEQRRRWNSTLLLSSDNPYILADSIPGDFITEQFSLMGAFSYAFNPYWKAGLRTTYIVGSSANQTDPRPETNGMRLLLTPGVMYTVGEWSVGLSVNAAWLSEAITYTSVRTTDTNYLFLFNGMGMYEGRTTNFYQRRYAGADYGADVQLLWQSAKTTSHTLQGGGIVVTEDAVDGSHADKYRGGLFARQQITIQEESRWGANSFIHTLTPTFQVANSTGTWFSQKQITDTDGNVVWLIKDQSIAHTEKSTNASLQYRMDWMKLSTPLLSTLIKVNYSRSAMRHFPDEFTQSYAHLTANAGVTKHWLMKYSRLSGSVGGLYSHGLNALLEADGIVLKDKFTRPLLAYKVASSFGANARIELSVAIVKPQTGSIISLFAGYKYRQYIGEELFFGSNSRHNILVGASWIF